MTDRPPYTETGGDSGAGSDIEPTTGSPLWVKVFGIVVLLGVGLLIVILLLVGHDPGGH